MNANKSTENANYGTEKRISVPTDGRDLRDSFMSLEDWVISAVACQCGAQRLRPHCGPAHVDMTGVCCMSNDMCRLHGITTAATRVHVWP